MNKEKLLNIAIITAGAILIGVFSSWIGYIWGYTAYQPEIVIGPTQEEVREICKEKIIDAVNEKDCPEYKPCEQDLSHLYEEVERLQLFEQMMKLKDELRERQEELNKNL